MLSNQTIETIQSTIPLLEEHGRTITDVFYDDLFKHHPSLKNIFNMANQGKGDQSRALSDAVIAYAKNIEQLETLLPTVQRIANKHVSLGVESAHYDIVGSTLLSAIQTVLSVDADHPAIQAWQEAYGVLANIFIDAENTLYLEKQAQTGGWQGFRDFHIEKIITETPNVKSFYFKPADLADIPNFQGGQYLGVRVKPDNNDYQQIRQYSLSQYKQPQHKHLRISVKAEQDGLVSNHLHHCQPGDLVQLQPPAGVFTLANKAKKHIFIAGGVGITPLISMAEQAMTEGAKNNDLLFIQCANDQNHQLFGNHLETLAEQKQLIYKRCFDNSPQGDHQGHLNTDILQQWLTQHDFSNSNAQVYFCGPKPFMATLNQIFLDIEFDPTDIHYEVFGPTTSLSS